ncbi:MAG: nucleoside phosphorylase [Acidimicrobiales bacterium]
MADERLPLFEDDLAEPGVIEAHMMHVGADPVAPAAVLCFFNELLERLAAEGRLRVVHTLRSEIGVNPVYELATDAGAVTVVHPGVGAPLAAAITEELVALGVTTFVACGGAGALAGDLALGHVMVVTSAVRDEGTSLHYVAPTRVIDADPLGVDVLSAALDGRGVAHYRGRTWTTDGFFRETPSRVARRRDEGCTMVDMESSAFLAVARYRSLRFAQLLYAGDSLAGEAWDSRQWDRAGEVRELLFGVAAAAARALHDA